MTHTSRWQKPKKLLRGRPQRLASAEKMTVSPAFYKPRDLSSGPPNTVRQTSEIKYFIFSKFQYLGQIRPKITDHKYSYFCVSVTWIVDEISAYSTGVDIVMIIYMNSIYGANVYKTAANQSHLLTCKRSAYTPHSLCLCTAIAVPM